MSVNEEFNLSSDKLILDTGGGLQGTIASRAWFVFERSRIKTKLEGYQSKKAKLCPIVNAITKVILSEDREVLFIMNNATLVDDPNESESLEVPYDMMRHGVSVDVVPLMYGGKQGITVDDEFLKCSYDDEKCFYYIKRPSQHDLDTLDTFEITSPYIYQYSKDKEIRRNKKQLVFVIFVDQVCKANILSTSKRKTLIKVDK